MTKSEADRAFVLAECRKCVETSAGAYDATDAIISRLSPENARVGVTDEMVESAVGEHDLMVFRYGTPDAIRDHMRTILLVALDARK